MEREEFIFRETRNYRTLRLTARVILLGVLLRLIIEVRTEDSFFPLVSVLLFMLLLMVYHERRLSALPRSRLIIDSNAVSLCNPKSSFGNWSIPLKAIYSINPAPTHNMLLIRHKGRLVNVTEIRPEEWHPLATTNEGSALLPLEHSLQRRGLMGEVRDDPNELKGATQHVAIALAPILFAALFIYAYDISVTLDGNIDPLLLLPFAIIGYFISSVYLRLHLTPRHLAVPLSIMISASTALLGYTALDKYDIQYGEPVGVNYRLIDIDESQQRWRDNSGYYPDITLDYGFDNAEDLIGTEVEINIINGALGMVQVRNYELGSLSEVVHSKSKARQ